MRPPCLGIRTNEVASTNFARSSLETLLSLTRRLRWVARVPGFPSNLPNLPGLATFTISSFCLSPLFHVQMSHSSAVQVRGFFRGFTGRFELLWLFKATTELWLVRKQEWGRIVYIDQIWHPCSGPKMVAPPVAPYQPTVTSNAKWQQFREGFQEGAGMSTSSNAFAQGKRGFCLYIHSQRL